MTTKQKIWAAVFGVVFVALVVSAIFFPHFLWIHIYADFWPLDASRVMPNLLASVVQWVILAGVATLVYPPFRRAVDRFAKVHVDDLKKHVSDEHQLLKDHITAEHAKIHTKIDQIHQNLGIVPEEENVPPEM